MSTRKVDDIEIDRKASHDASETDINASEKAIERARAAIDKEHRMSLLEGIRTYPKAIGWSMLISLCIAMEAFDLVLLKTFCKTAISMASCEQVI